MMWFLFAAQKPLIILHNVANVIIFKQLEDQAYFLIRHFVLKEQPGFAHP